MKQQFLLLLLSYKQFNRLYGFEMYTLFCEAKRCNGKLIGQNLNNTKSRHTQHTFNKNDHSNWLNVYTMGA